MPHLSVLQVRGINPRLAFCEGGGIATDWIAQSFKMSSDSQVLEMCWLEPDAENEKGLQAMYNEPMTLQMLMNLQ